MKKSSKTIKQILLLAGIAAIFGLFNLSMYKLFTGRLSNNFSDALLSIVQMPGGIPVATVAINQAKNAALLAIQMLAITDEKLAKKLENYKIEMRDKVLNAKLED